MEGMVLELFSFLVLLSIAVFSFVISKKIKFPYTLFLVLVGTVLAFLAQIPFFSFLDAFQLSPEILFYIFLPTLLFEAGYNIKISKISESYRGIFYLAIIGLITSTILIGFLLVGILSLFSIDIPLVIALLFGAIISATDPVAVISMFKEYSAPKRLTLIFEGESLFNDGTAVALFTVLLAVIAEHNGVLGLENILMGIGLFFSMLIMGFVFGFIFGIVFSKFLEYARNENLQITLSLLVAHFTFLISEIVNEYWGIPVSAIVATVVASIIVGNYGRYKLTPKVEKYIDNFWEYFAFIANSMVFLLLGFLLTHINFSGLFILTPIAIAIIVTMFARAVSVYFSAYLLSFQKNEKAIPKKWQHLLSWGSLRGALAITMVLLIPDDLTLESWNYPISIKEFIMALVIGSIYFTLFVKGLSIGRLIKKLNISKISNFEKMSYLEGKAIVLNSIKNELEEEFKIGEISKKEFKLRLKNISVKHENVKNKIKKYFSNSKNKSFFKRSLNSYAIGVEKEVLEEIYSRGEITEKSYKRLLLKLEKQSDMLDSYHSDIDDHVKGNNIINNFLDLMEKIFNGKEEIFSKRDQYFYYKALRATSKRAIESLEKIIDDLDFLKNEKIVKETIERYKNFYSGASNKLIELLKKNPELEFDDRKYIKGKMIFKEKEVLKNISNNCLISEKVKNILDNEIRDELEKDFK